ncbi:hypothetical protein [Sodalis-like endosymbiont of Proechinophthirus fluctus]
MQTLRTSVSLAKKVTLVIVVVLLTISIARWSSLPNAGGKPQKPDAN